MDHAVASIDDAHVLYFENVSTPGNNRAVSSAARCWTARSIVMTIARMWSGRRAQRPDTFAQRAMAANAAASRWRQ